MKLEAGAVIGGRYTLLGPLDRGAMGAVWVARDANTREQVALKVLTQSLLDETSARRFQREARALMHLDHSHVVKLRAHGLQDNTPYIAMELLDGETLRSLIKRRRALPPAEVVEFLQQAAAGLSAVHALGIVHRDVKPGNLFVSTSGSAAVLKIIDFGIAAGEAIETGDTLTHGLIGSPAYMSPEQARGERVDHLADVWSLAVVAFELLTGKEPFAATDLPETFQRICSGIPPKASAVASGLPAGTDALFERAFAADREKRFQSVTRLVDELAKVCAGAPHRPAKTLSSPPSSGRVTATTTTRQPETIVRYTDAIHCLAWHENVQITLSLGQPSLEFMLKSTAELAALNRKWGKHCAVMVVIRSDADPPDEPARDYIRREIKRIDHACLAQVVEGTGFRGAAVRSALSMIAFAMRAPFPIKIFGEVDDAARWLSTELRTRTGHGPDQQELAKAVSGLRSRFKDFSAR